MAKGVRTLAMRVLDARKIEYKVYLFPDVLRDAEEVAASLDTAPGLVFKTLVLLNEDKPGARPMLVMVPADRHIDLRHFAKEIQTKSVRMASQAQAEKLTGLKVGGISALALLNRPFDIYIDESAKQIEYIMVSGGQRGIDLELRTSDLIALTSAQIVNATHPKDH